MPIFSPNKDIIAGSNISVTQTTTSATVSVTNVGSPNGIAGLDSGGKVPITQLPSSIMEYKGTWNATTNTPTLADGSGDVGDTYRVSVGGTINLGSGSITFDVGDYCIYNGTIWEKSDTTDAVASVNGLTGNVTLTTANVSDSTDKRYITDAQKVVLTNTSGTNSGDQNIFQRISIAGNSDVVADTTSDTLTLVAGTNVTLTTNATTDTITINSTGTTNNYNTYSGFGFKNAIINSTFNVTQRIIPGSAILWNSTHPISPNNDANYNFDRWYLLSDGNNKINISQETASLPANGVQTGCRLTQVATAAANGKFGIAQIVESANIPAFLGYYANMQAKLRVSDATRLTDIRMAIIAWNGTADTVTRDFISAWNGNGVNPTLVANASYLNTPSNLAIPDVWQVDALGRPVIYSVVAGLSTTVKNLIVFIYSNTVGTTANDFLTICDVQLEALDASSNFEYVPYDVQLMRAQRYFYGLYASGTAMAYCNTNAVSTIRQDGQFTFPVFMRTSPGLTTSAANTFKLNAAGSVVLSAVPSAIRSYPAGVYLQLNASTASFNPGDGAILVDNGTTGPISYMLFSSEL